MVVLAFYAVALTAAGWAVSVRSRVWLIPWERPTTSAIAQLILALVLIAPATESYIGWLGWELTGRWHLDDLLGHIFELGAFVSSNIAGMMRMPTVRRYIEPLLWYPLVIGTAVEMMLFWQSCITHNPHHDIYRLSHDHWLTMFFVVQCLLLGYYGGINAWCALAHLRSDPRSRPVALAWLVCTGLLAGGMVGFVIASLHSVPGDYIRPVMCVAVTIFAVTSARSWQRKLDPWRRLIRVTGARL
jgi:hypothetical protein